jgi:hypothetical protein
MPRMMSTCRASRCSCAGRNVGPGPAVCMRRSSALCVFLCCSSCASSFFCSSSCSSRPVCCFCAIGSSGACDAAAKPTCDPPACDPPACDPPACDPPLLDAERLLSERWPVLRRYFCKCDLMFCRVGIVPSSSQPMSCWMACGFALATPSLCTAISKRWCRSGVHTKRCFFSVPSISTSSSSSSGGREAEDEVSFSLLFFGAISDSGTTRRWLRGRSETDAAAGSVSSVASCLRLWSACRVAMARRIYTDLDQRVRRLPKLRSKCSRSAQKVLRGCQQMRGVNVKYQ